MRLSLCMLLAVCLACTKGLSLPRRHPPAAEATTSKEWFGFPSYPNARKLCAEHVSGQDLHIQWISYATRASPEEVVAFYRPGTTAKELRLEGKEDTRLVVFAAAEAAKFPGCEQLPTSDEQTIIMVSKAVR